MARPEYVPIECKSALNRVQGMPFRWSANPFIGCRHDCVFCFARSYWLKAERGAANEFSTRVYVKVNFAERLARELRRPSLQGEHVVLGTATDIYQPVEGRYRLTRRVLEVLAEHRNPISMLTKSPLIVRDIDVLGQIAGQSEVMVFFSITTIDLELWRSLELGTANPYHRLRAMQRLRATGIPAGVLMAPILPGITDSEAAIDGVAAAAAEHGALSFGAPPLRLMAGVKEHYLEFVEATFPWLYARYVRAYPGVHAPPDYRERLAERVTRVRQRYGFQSDELRPSRHLPEQPHAGGAQLALGL